MTWDSSYTAPTPGVTNIITAVNTISVAEKINLYPNPSEGNLFISFPSLNSFEIRIFSVTGNLLFNEIIHAGLKIHQLDLSDFSAGLYFLSLNNGESIFTKKIIIK